MNLDDLDLTFLLDIVTEYAIAIVTALAIFLIGKWLARRIVNVIRTALNKAKVDPTLVGFFANIAYALLLALVIIAALSQLGVETASFAAILAAAGLAIGLALQGSLSNFAAGVLIILFRPFSKGHYIEAGGSAGTVHDINIFTTLLITPDNRHAIIPNSSITGGPIINYSAEGKRRIDLVVGVGYGDDLNKVQSVLHDVLAKDTRVLKDPEAVVEVLTLGESSVDFAVRPWVSTDDFWPTRFALMKEIKMRLDAEGISIPFPQREVHVFEAGKA